MTSARARRREQRHFRGDVVQRLNQLQREAVIAAYQLAPREPGEFGVPQIAVRAPEAADPASVLDVVRERCVVWRTSKNSGGRIVLDRGLT